MVTRAHMPALGRRVAVRRLAGLAALGTPLAATFAGCALNSAPRNDFYVLEDLKAGGRTAPGAPRIDRVLLLAPGPSQSMYDSDRIVFSTDGVSRAYFQYASWTERPARRVLALAEGRLAGTGAFRAVASSTSGVRGDLLLTLRLDELFHDPSVTPSRTTVSVQAELMDWRARAFIARQTFTQSVPAVSNDALGATRAANQAITMVLDDLAAWAESTAARLVSTR